MKTPLKGIFRAILALGALSFLCSCATPRPPEVFPHAEKPYFTFYGTDYPEIQKSPDRYVGQFYAIRGKIIDITEDANSVLAQILTQRFPGISNEPGVSIIVKMNKPIYDQDSKVGYTRLAKDEYINAIGFFAGEASGRNIYGGVVNSIRFDAIAINNLHEDFFMPAYKETYDLWKAGHLWHKTGPEKRERQGLLPRYQDYEK